MRLPLRPGLPLLLGLLLGTAAAQPVTDPVADPAAAVAAVEAAYERLDYETAEALAREALAHYEAFTPDQLVRLHTLLGLILYARGEALEAAVQFRAALTLDPTLTLDPLLVSPATIAFFEETKGAFLREQSSGAEPPGEVVRYVRVFDPRPAAFERSLVLPGWGQRYKGETTKGWVLTGVWVAGMVASAAAIYRYRQLRADYDAAGDPDLASARYDAMNTWYKVRNSALLGTAVVWALTAVEAGVTGGPDEALAVAPAPNGLALRVRF